MTMSSRFQTITTETSLGESKNNFRQFYEIHDNVDLKKEEVPQYMAHSAIKTVIDKVIEHQNCHATRSESSCNLNKMVLKTIEPSIDPRLAKWQRVLQMRKKLQQRIQNHTGKRAEDVLFNRQSTIDEPKKQMLFRVLDNATRMNPTNVSKAKAAMATLKPRCEVETCQEIRELVATKTEPNPLEFVGLPRIIQKEIAAINVCKDSKWEQSTVLEHRIEKKATDIKRVLEFAPEVEKLAVTSTWTKPTIDRMNKALVYEDSLKEVSLDTGEERFTKSEAAQTVETTPQFSSEPELEKTGLKINGRLYSFRELVTPNFAAIQVFMQCDPHQRVVKTLLELENRNTKLLCANWQLRRIRAQKASESDSNLESFEFIFDNRSFTLVMGEHRRFEVMFRPQCVGLFKQCWHLHLQQSPFCGTGSLTIRIQGLCTMPAIYRERLDHDLNIPVKNHKAQLVERLALQHAGLAVDIANKEYPGPMCPYDRTLTELEVFNIQNTSYKCERHGDLESLKELYDLMKLPRDPSWDYRIETLQQLIMCQTGLIQRQTLQKRLLEVLEPMKFGQSKDGDALENDKERDRSCSIYVRGAINNAIDDWENMTIGLEQQFFKNEFKRQMINLRETGPEELEPAIGVDSEHVLKTVKGGKYFRDALYMQTYSLLCNAAEDIVSIIESTGRG